MKRNCELIELQELVLQCDVSILYKPLGKEIDYSVHSFPLQIHKNNLTLPDNKDSNPFEWANKCVAKFKNTKPYILVPGTQFDIHGTRIGKGGGWFDRFLSKVPRAWLRVGVTDKSQMSDNRLLKQSWDEPVDWIVVSNNNSWEIHKIKSTP